MTAKEFCKMLKKEPVNARKTKHMTSDEIPAFLKEYSQQQNTHISTVFVSKATFDITSVVTLDNGRGFVFSNLSFGYGGGGPSALHETLLIAGVDDDEANKVEEEGRCEKNMLWRIGHPLEFF